MHEEAPFRIIFVGLYVAGLLMRSLLLVQLKLRGDRIVPPKEDSGESSRFRIVFQSVMFFFWIVVVVSYAWYPSWMEQFHLPVPPWLRYSGALFGAAAFFLLTLTMNALGQYWSPLPRLMDGHRLVTRGPYRFVRHPMYSAMMILFISFVFVTANVIVAVTSLIAIILTIKWAVKEEAILLDFFGEEYRSYMECTGAFTPNPGKIVRHFLSGKTSRP
jgi:protein-S-isoprenylcysteine O-methyltransferase Ste14